MTIKLALLKSGEDVISDIQEMVVEDKVIGYFLNNPLVVKLKNIDNQSNNKKTTADISLYPWMPLSKDQIIPITVDWIITIVDPVDNLFEMYKNIMENKEKND